MKQRPRIYYSAEQKTLMWDRWQAGDSLHEIARLFDRGHSSIQGVLAETGGIRPRPRSRSRLALSPDTSKADASDICVLKIPARVRTRGVQLKIVMENPAGAVQRNPDPALIKALGRAFDWLQSVKAGQVSSVSDIAVAENLTGSYVTRVLRLAFLAPNIVEAIITGTQPAELTLDRILRGGILPLTWPEQRRHLGFPTG